MANTIKPPLIICVGNPSRGDDAAGHWVASILQAAGVDVIETFQLQPELVADMVHHDDVIIVDAHANLSMPLNLRPIQATDPVGWCSHALSPEQLLGFFSVAYQMRPPEVIAIGIQAQSFELGATISDQTLAIAGIVAASLIKMIELSVATKDRYEFLEQGLDSYLKEVSPEYALTCPAEGT